MIKRFCDACGDEIPDKTAVYINLIGRVMKPEESDEADPLDQAWGDYCVACVRSGKATADLLPALKTERLSE